MENRIEKKIECPVCGFPTCFEEDGGRVTSWMCFTCGYTTNTLLVIGSPYVEHAEKTTAQLIRELKFEDTERNLVWFLSVVRTPDGMVFPDGVGNDWEWSCAPVVPVDEKDKHKYPVPGESGKYYETRLAVEQAKQFPRTEFLEACKALGFVVSKGEDE